MFDLLQSLRLSLLHVGYAKLNHEWDFDNVISPFTRLFFVTKGTAMVYHSDMSFSLKPGHMYLIPSYVYNRYRCEDFHEQYYLSFFDEIKTGLSIYSIRDFHFEVKATEHDEYLFKRLLKLYPKRAIQNNEPKAYVHHVSDLLNVNQRDAKTRTDSYIETCGILSILLSRFVKNTSPLNTQIEGKSDFNQILIYIAENLHRPLTIKHLADQCHLSSDHFSRVFKMRIGIRPNKYIQSRRVQRAQLLLLTTNHSLEQIAEKVGLENFSYFSRTFKKLTGMTPGSFRKEGSLAF